MLGDQARLYKMYKDRFKPGMKVAITVHPADLYTNIEVQNAGLINATNVLGQLGLLNFVDQKALTKLLLKRIAGLRDTDQLLNSGEQLFTANDFAMILQESNLLLQGQQIQPQPTDNHKAHVEGHRAVLGTYTFSPNAPALLEHIKMHEQFMAALAAQMMGGPAALPDMMGGAGGGVNPARQPAPTSDEAASRSAGNAAGAVGEPGGF
jgi:hypothetical protein